MSRNRKPKDLLDQVKELQERVRRLELERRVGNSTLSSGGQVVLKGGSIVVEHPNGAELFRIGRAAEQPDPFDTTYVTRIGRPDGSSVLTVESTDATEGRMRLYDRQENEVLSDDWITGTGLSRPYLTIDCTPTSQHLAPSNGTNSATFFPVWTVNAVLQHMGIRMIVLIKADTGVGGEMQIREKFFDTVLGAAVPIAVGDWAYIDITRGLPGLYGHGITYRLDLEFRVTSGVGSIFSQVVLCQGVPFTF